MSVLRVYRVERQRQRRVSAQDFKHCSGSQQFLTGKSDDVIQAIADTNPVGRLGRAGEISEVVRFLASPAGGWVSG